MANERTISEWSNTGINEQMGERVNERMIKQIETTN